MTTPADEQSTAGWASSAGRSAYTTHDEQGHALSRTVLTGIGGCCVVVGGLVAAVTGPLDLTHGSWLAAYLVLVGGVAQYAMGHARRLSDVVRSHRRPIWAQIGGWNLGNALVITGTLASEPLAVDVGSVLLVAALAIALHAARPTTGPATRPAADRMPRPAAWAYRALLLVLLVSIPAGAAISHLRPS